MVRGYSFRLDFSWPSFIATQARAFAGIACGERVTFPRGCTEGRPREFQSVRIVCLGCIVNGAPLDAQRRFLLWFEFINKSIARADDDMSVPYGGGAFDAAARLEF
jgi:hypothetical protein